MLKSNIIKINDGAYFVIDLPSYSASIIKYDHTLANQTICCHEEVFFDDVIEEIPQKENQKENKS